MAATQNMDFLKDDKIKSTNLKLKFEPSIHMFSDQGINFWG